MLCGSKSSTTSIDKKSSNLDQLGWFWAIGYDLMAKAGPWIEYLCQSGHRIDDLLIQLSGELTKNASQCNHLVTLFQEMSVANSNPKIWMIKWIEEIKERTSKWLVTIGYSWNKGANKQVVSHDRLLTIAYKKCKPMQSSCHFVSRNERR